ncbi:glycoside hydrolase family 53 protein [Microbulbifer harenosus]|uniref:Arabinogalactan endo-beta-1,4-galactanase n=1 Tax=Microbulbifer harenosus TaxID=2576840 RepID=A0ABY2UM96_9GAMM|nr:glycosyl hydrolase 53 family protein [Microbulbifer harenosus]TLM79659.1 arabinogalactan endo-1,4-beta-galactosidase [Microbulbifer harenosus]
MRNQIFLLGLAAALAGCQSTPTINSTPTSSTVAAEAPLFYAGADLSYVNEMEDCGARFLVNGEARDPVQIFADAGTNLVRVRLWHNPQWTNYSNFEDAAKMLARAKQAGLPVLLDFHYSDTWADPEKQIVPAAWEHIVGDTAALGDALYRYTFDSLAELERRGLVPDMVQVGNETNNEILQTAESMQHETIDWHRNAALLDRGLQAVADFNRQHNTDIQRMLHIAQPENALNWFADAEKYLQQDYELIGLSYYGKWSEYSVSSVGEAIVELREKFGKDVIIVETSYPWTLKNYDQAENVLGSDSLVPGYPATAEGQLRYLDDLANTVKNAGGIGVVYWEPAWVSTQCKTLWGQGSHWENAGMFDPARHNAPLPSLAFFKRHAATPAAEMGTDKKSAMKNTEDKQ